MKVRLTDITVKQGRRAVDESKVLELAQSMAEIGLINPITVTQDKTLITGAHRLAAAKLLGWSEIEATVSELEGLRAELAEIDENLMRNDLHYIDRGNSIKRRCEILRMLGLMATAGRPTKNQSESDGFLTNKELANKIGVSETQFKIERQIATNILPEVQEAIKAADLSKTDALKIARMEPKEQMKVAERLSEGAKSYADAVREIKAKEKAAQIAQAKESIASQTKKADNRPIIHLTDSRTFNVGEKYDLLLTDPPYSTDVPDLEAFVDSWLYKALDGVKNTGFAYVFIGAYPNELKAYLNARIPDHLTLEQVLVWTYKNTLGNNPKDRYKQNYQACLFFRGINAPSLDCPLTTEQWAVQEINAPDGRQGDRYHAWQKPMEIAERFIRHTTKQGDLVYDPFACTGTFILAASKLGRRGIGCEIDGDNAQIAMNRGCAVWREASGNP